MSDKEQWVGDCVKFGCRKRAVTVEREHGEGAEWFPSSLCADHARRPDRRGTLEQPTIVEIRNA